MKVSYVSDLHLEFGNYPDILANDSGGDVLILAGDITVTTYLRKDRTDKDSTKNKARIKRLADDLFSKYDRVLYVMGNHEHYGSIYKRTYKNLREGLDELGLIEKVTILEDDHTVIDGVPFVGATLWSDFFNADPSAMYIAEKGMNDFHVIGSLDVDDINYFNKNDSRRITPEFILSVHKQSREYFDYIAKFYEKKDVVVISHHAPTYQSLNKIHSGNSLDGAYASNLSEFILDRPNIKYWIHGHCHMNTDYMVGNCRVLSNQRGYPSEESFNTFQGLQSFHIT